MNNSVILYYLGAGASCQVLPLASEFANRLSKFAAELENAGPKDMYGDPKPTPDDPLWGRSRDTFLKAIGWLSQETSRHASVDTFAKKLFFRRDRGSLKKLKAALSAYLVVEQSKRPVDMRYDAFLATLLELGEDRYPRLPENIRIITWNYDTQLEKAFYGFCEDDKYVFENITSNDHIYKINGCCAPGKAGLSKTPDAPAWEAGIRLYEEFMADSSTIDIDIRFAWEETTDRILSNTRLRIQNLSTVVLIGYSFPYFNREIDAAIFSILSDSNMHRIYLQYPEGMHTSVEERLKTFLLREDIEMVRISSTDFFYIPDDLWKI